MLRRENSRDRLRWPPSPGLGNAAWQAPQNFVELSLLARAIARLWRAPPAFSASGAEAGALSRIWLARRSSGLAELALVLLKIFHRLFGAHRECVQPILPGKAPHIPLALVPATETRPGGLS